MEVTLEIRGISVNQLVTYLLELGGAQQDSVYLVRGANWDAELIREEEKQITSRFRVNAVFIRFRADTEEQLNQLLASFRKKTMRVGG
jgi:hypothetical protein